MRVAVVMESVHDGTGGFQDALSKTISLKRANSSEHEFIVFTPHKKSRDLLAKEGIKSILFAHRIVRLLDRWSASAIGRALMRRLRRYGIKRLGRHFDAVLDDHGIDLVLFTDCGEVGLRLADHPFIITIWDQFNRDLPEFPEVFTDRQFELLERVPSSLLARAIAVIVDSSAGGHRIAALYRVDPRRIIELPFLPSLAVRRHAQGAGSTTIENLRRKYDLPERYLFYPSFPAPTKNNLYILDSLVTLERRHKMKLPVVFCGG